MEDHRLGRLWPPAGQPGRLEHPELVSVCGRVGERYHRAVDEAEERVPPALTAVSLAAIRVARGIDPSSGSAATSSVRPAAPRAVSAASARPAPDAIASSAAATTRHWAAATERVSTTSTARADRLAAIEATRCMLANSVAGVRTRASSKAPSSMPSRYSASVGGAEVTVPGT